MKEVDTEDMLSQILFPYLREGGKSRPESDRPLWLESIKPAPLKRYLLHTSIAAQIVKEYHRRKITLQRFILGVIQVELDKFRTGTCLCGCGTVFDPFIQYQSGNPQWFVRGHNLRLYQEIRPREKRYIELLREHGPIGIYELSLLADEPYKMVANFLSELSSLNLILRVSEGVYMLHPVVNL